MRKTRFGLVLMGAFLVCSYAIIQYGFFSPTLAGLVQVKLKSHDFHVTPWVYFLYIHILTGCLALLIGPFQIFRKQNTSKRIKSHRLLGRIYVVSVLVSSIVNVYLSVFVTGGFLSGTAFFVLDLLWVYCTITAVLAIKRGNISLHRNWMLRSYALTFAAVTLRIYLFIFRLIFEQFETAYIFSAWLSWTINLMIIEIIIIKQKTKNTENGITEESIKLTS